MASRFSATQLEEFKNSLHSKLVALNKMEHQLEDEALHRPQEIANDRILPTDWSSETANLGVNLKIADQEITEANDIKAALERMNANTYGICEECEEEIPVRRLQVLPEARFCVKCEEEFENENSFTRMPMAAFELEEPSK